MSHQDDTQHVIPRDDLINHPANDDCPCGPTSEPLTRNDGSVGWVVVHHSLDGREASENRRPDCDTYPPHPQPQEPVMTQHITTPDDLDALPVGSVIRIDSGQAFSKVDDQGADWKGIGDPVNWNTNGVLAESDGLVTVLFRPDAPTPTPDEADPADRTEAVCLTCNRPAIEHTRGRYSVFGVCPTPDGYGQREALARHLMEWFGGEDQPVIDDYLAADAALAWFAARPTAPTVEQMTEVLVYHCRTGAHTCRECGDLPLGSSFARHQAEQIAALRNEVTG